MRYERPTGFRRGRGRSRFSSSLRAGVVGGRGCALPLLDRISGSSEVELAASANVPSDLWRDPYVFLKRYYPDIER